MTEQANTIKATSISTLSSKMSVEDASLCVLEGPHAGLEIPLNQERLQIGRADWCDVPLPDDQWVSNLHCECAWDDKGLRVRDLKSRNGITLEGCPVLDGYLIEDAKLGVGKSIFQLKLHQARREIPIPFQDASGLLVGKSPAMRHIFSLLSRLGKRAVTTLLLGETGTGKTSVARSIHIQRKLQQKTTPQQIRHNDAEIPFVMVNCGALPANLIEGVLFGYEKGAFTGANKSHAGLFEQANGGTLFLDEIAELPISLQPKLLDVIERKHVRRLGSTHERQVDFHLLCATHRDLPHEIKEGRFREDLYFRISVVELEVPPLRERKEDLPLLVEHLLKELHPTEPYFITEAAIQRLHHYLWPGNIRELRNQLERSITFLDGNTIDAETMQLPQNNESTERKPQLTTTHQASPETASPDIASWLPTMPLKQHQPAIPLKELLANTERFLLLQALDECQGNVLKASQLLGISDSWFYNRLKKYKLNPSD